MGLRAAIVVGLENIRVRSGLRGERVRVISVQPLPTPSAPTEAVAITVETMEEGTRLTASAQILARDITNYCHVIEAMSEALRRELHQHSSKMAVQRSSGS